MDLEPTNIFQRTPLGALVQLPEAEATRLLNAASNMPPSLAQMLTSLKTGAFLDGLIKTYDLPQEALVSLPIAVLLVALGQLALNKLSGALAQELNLSGEVSKKIASEIEKELFAPISLELNGYLNKKQVPVAPRPPSAAPPAPPSITNSLPNVLDLKNKPFDQAQGKPPL